MIKVQSDFILETKENQNRNVFYNLNSYSTFKFCLFEIIYILKRSTKMGSEDKRRKSRSRSKSPGRDRKRQRDEDKDRHKDRERSEREKERRGVDDREDKDRRRDEKDRRKRDRSRSRERRSRSKERHDRKEKKSEKSGKHRRDADEDSDADVKSQEAGQAKKAEPLSLEELLAKKKAEEAEAAKPKFLTKAERAELVSFVFEESGLGLFMSFMSCDALAHESLLIKDTTAWHAP